MQAAAESVFWMFVGTWAIVVAIFFLPAALGLWLCLARMYWCWKGQAQSNEQHTDGAEPAPAASPRMHE